MPLSAKPVPGSMTAPITADMEALADAAGARERTGTMNAIKIRGTRVLPSAMPMKPNSFGSVTAFLTLYFAVEGSAGGSLAFC